MAYPRFTPDEMVAIERFIEIVLKRQGQVAALSGIEGSFARALHDIARDLRAESTKMRHKRLAEECHKKAQGGDIPTSHDSDNPVQ